MATSPISSSPAAAPAIPSAGVAVPGSVPEPAPGTAPPTTADNPQRADTQQTDTQILRANLQVSISARNEPLALVLRTALEAINEQLAPVFGEDAIATAVEQGIDVSPEATADRIVGQSTALFARFQESNPELSPRQQVERFLEVIGAGIERGFAEAREILEGLSVLKGEVAANIDSTFELVQQGLEGFRQRELGEASEAAG